MKQSALRKMVRAAMLAALYAILTDVWPFSIGPLQCRLSEALCVLPYIMPEAVPGLFLGCLLGNFLAGAALPDVILGSFATLIAALLTRWAGKRNLPPFFASLPPVLVNGAVIGALLCFVYDYGLSYPAAVLQVAGGEAICCYILGLPLLHAIKRSGRFI